ncbi:MAG: acyloxyacyl hydrolase, partial [Cyanobacteria bacterium P01_A01_bin.17]
GITHFFASGHSINVSLNTLDFSQECSDSIGINIDGIARWHFLRKKTWSLFVDGGVGILNTTSRVPLIGGSRFNFTPQVGGGASLRIAEKTRLLMGIRWHHISNANLFEPNDGQDAVFGWVGLDLPR